jgi:glucans biosynthesis protein
VSGSLFGNCATPAAALLLAPALLLAAPGLSADSPTQGFDTDLLEQARTLAGKPYVAPSTALPPPFAGLDYDAYRAIRPAVGRAAMLPLGGDFAVDLLPPGLYFPDPVAIEWPAANGAFRQKEFTPALFDFAPEYFDDVPDEAPGAGFSGLRLRSALNRADVLDEVLVMQGASYFRAVGRAMAYGLSARAVAIGTGGPLAEEFPRFTQLRLYEASGNTLRLEGLIDSPSLAGHMDMRLRPGADTEADIVVTLIPRREISDIGVAPLTSMFLKGPLRAAVSDDFRPRVHDSDLLLIENGAGELLWRPLANPARIETSAFGDENPAAFGLWQTARRFEDFEDSEARYHDRPSARVEPAEDWGAGAVVLVEIPTGDEFMDNVVAFWRPSEALMAGTEYRYAYRLTWTRRPPTAASEAGIRQSRSGREHDQPGKRRFVVDFSGDATALTPDLSASDGAGLSGLSLFPLPDGRGTRVTFLVAPGDLDVAELRLVLRDAAGAAASPVWLHRWTRARDGGV